MNFLKVSVTVILLLTFSNVRADIFVPQMICADGNGPWIADSLDGRSSWPTADEARKAGERYAQRMQGNGATGCKVNDIFVGNLNQNLKPMSKMSTNDKKRYTESNNQKLANSSSNNQTESSKKYFVAFACLSDDQFLGVSKSLSETFLSYLMDDNVDAFSQLISTSGRYFRGATFGECKPQGYYMKNLPIGEPKLFGQNAKARFWLISTRGLSGGGFYGATEFIR